MQSLIKAVLLVISIAVLVIPFVLGSVSPALAQTVSTTSKVKRDYSYSNSQHLTARFGNDRVCGDHLCASGEWAKLQENLSQAQIVHHLTNTTKVASVSSNTTMTATNPNSQVQTPPASPTPTPIPTPPAGPSAICVAVKAVLANSTVPSTTVTKVMVDLGCTS